MKCFYHNDSDGKCAGYWVAMSAALNNDDHPSEFIQIDYTMPFPLETILPNEQIYIVDYSISPSEMDELLKITADVTWIDHHITAIDKYKDYPHEIRGVRYDGVSGCMLTYCYLHKMTNRGAGAIKLFHVSMMDDAPLFTKLIDDWDIWRHQYGNDTKHFQIAFNAYDFSPHSIEWGRFAPDTGDGGLIKQGRIISRYSDGWATSYCASKGFEAIFEGYKCFALNLGLCNSEYFKSIDNSEYDILMPFSFDGSKWTYSMYSKTVDVSEIAKKYGGGGHKGASGFTSSELLLRRSAQ